MHDPIHQSLELAAEAAGDISPAVYRKYFDRCAGSAELMSHIDDIVRGRMLDEVVRLILLPRYEEEQQYLDFEVRNHRTAYSVEPHMYANLLTALRDTVRESLNGKWTAAFDAAWDDRVTALLTEIEKRA